MAMHLDVESKRGAHGVHKFRTGGVLGSKARAYYLGWEGKFDRLAAHWRELDAKMSAHKSI
jgi:hypothetical protein